MAAEGHGTLRWVVVATVGVLATGAFGLALSGLATPTDFGSRRRAAEDASHLARPATSPSRPISCNPLHVSDDRQLRAMVTTALAGSGLRLKSIAFGASAEVHGGTLSVRRLVFSAEGRHPAEARALTALDQALPGLFVDELNMTSRESGLMVGFKGRLLCRASVKG